VEVAEGIAGVAGSLLDHMLLVGEVFTGEGEVDNVAAFLDGDGGEETAADGGGVRCGGGDGGGLYVEGGRGFDAEESCEESRKGGGVGGGCGG
jgi:hypothetical protein